MKRLRSGALFWAAALLLIAIMLGPVIAMLAAVTPAQALNAFSAEAARSALRVSLVASGIAVAAARSWGFRPGTLWRAHPPAYAA